MDDLSGLDWSSSAGSNSQKSALPTSANYYPSLRPTPPPPTSSGRLTPLSASNSNPSSKPSTPANDSFSNLVSFGSTKSTNNLSLQERQRQLLAQRQKEEEERKGKLQSQFGSSESSFWEQLGRGAPKQEIPVTNTSTSEDDDLLAAFSSKTKVDSSSHFPPPSNVTSGLNTPFQESSKTPLDVLDVDPFNFGKAQGTNSRNQHSTGKTTQNEDEDDILGLLGKPVSELPPAKLNTVQQQKDDQDKSPSQDPIQKSVVELTDMGFSEEKAREALASTSTGHDTQAAVSFLLNQAHQATSTSSRPAHSQSRREENPRISSTNRGQSDGSGRLQDHESRRNASSEQEISQLASEVGAKLFKSANSLWKSGRQKVQKAVVDLQQDGDPSQPKWMRDAQMSKYSQTYDSEPNIGAGLSDERGAAQRSSGPPRKDTKMTDEALMLELNDSKPMPRNSRPPQASGSGRSTRDQSPALSNGPESVVKKPAWMNVEQRPAFRDVKAQLSRQITEEQSSQAYISPARRKKSAPAPKSQDSVSDLMFDGTNQSQRIAVPTRSKESSNPFRSGEANASSSKVTAAAPVRPKASARIIPPISDHALQSSNKHRAQGSEAFKRGDYAAAHVAYTSSLTSLPEGHPLLIIVLANRALTGIKIGEPKATIIDTDRALSLIGPSLGESEKIDTAEGPKDMREFYGKVVMRKAEALEAMEKWDEALAIWSQAVRTGHGGSIAIQGRNRCEKASGKEKVAPVTARPPASKKHVPTQRKHNTLSGISGQSQTQNTGSTEAVKQLRAANAAAEKADDEKFALSDTVDAKLTAWKGSKADNLRALLSSLDKVLWPEAGWKPVGMAELVLPGKVKIHYMKGIAKVHPDKIPTTATTEQRMISGAVFSTLNEAWDKFKKENGI